MDQNPGDIDAKLKEEVEKELDLAIMDAYEKGTIDYMDLKTITGKIIANFDYYTTAEEITEFIDTLNSRWNIFGPAKTRLQSGNVHNSEQAVINKLSSYIKNYPSNQ